MFIAGKLSSDAHDAFERKLSVCIVDIIILIIFDFHQPTNEITQKQLPYIPSFTHFSYTQVQLEFF